MSGVWVEHADCRTFNYPWDANVIICDPPQLSGKYCANWLLNDGTFEHFNKGWIRRANQYLTQDGVLIVFCLPEFQFDYERIIRTITTLHYHQTIIWNYAFGTYVHSKFVCSHMSILVYGRQHSEFNWKAVAVESQRQRDLDPRCDARGRTPSDVWSDVWDIPRMPGNQKQRYGSEPQLPIKLITRLLKAYNARRVIDMMTGVGTVPAICKYLNIPCVGTEVDERICKIAQERVLEKFDEKRLV